LESGRRIMTLEEAMKNFANKAKEKGKSPLDAARDERNTMAIGIQSVRDPLVNFCVNLSRVANLDAAQAISEGLSKRIQDEKIMESILGCSAVLFSLLNRLQMASDMSVGMIAGEDEKKVQ
jgi:hypothetical protein